MKSVSKQVWTLQGGVWEGGEKRKTASYNCASVYLGKGSLFVFILHTCPRISRNAPVGSRALGSLAKSPDGQSF